MSPFIYEIVVYLVEAFVSGIFILNILEAKYNKAFQLLLWFQIVVVSILITPSFSVLRIAVIVLLEFVFTLFMYEDKFKRKILIFCFKEMIIIVSSLSSFLLYRVFVNGQVGILNVCQSSDCTYTLLYLITFSVFTSIVFQFVKKVKGVEFPWVIGTQVVIGIGEIGAVVAVAKTDCGIINSKDSWIIVSSMVFMVFSNISIGMLAPYLLKRISMSNNMNYGQELSNMEFKYYEMSVENDKKLMSVKHDISNHIQTIYSLLKNGETQKGLEFVDELKKRYALVEQMVYCENPVINIILSNKKNEAETKNIETQIKIREDLKTLSVTDFDLSTVICNLLDNAIRGCVLSEQSHPRMIVEILKKNGYLVIRVLNSCKISMNIESTDRIETTKSNSQTHGFGMPIIAGIAQKYKGDFVVSAQNGLFTATVIMSIKEV